MCKCDREVGETTMMTKIRKITVTMIQKQFQKLVRSVDYQLTRLYVMHIIPHVVCALGTQAQRVEKQGKCVTMTLADNNIIVSNSCAV